VCYEGLRTATRGLVERQRASYTYPAAASATCGASPLFSIEFVLSLYGVGPEGEGALVWRSEDG